MKNARIGWLILFMLARFSLFAHKDRIELPVSIQFTFQNGDTVTLTEKDKALLDEYSNDMVTGKRKFTNATFYFKTGETLLIKYQYDLLWQIEIAMDGKKGTVPISTIDKIKGIHFNSLALLWDGRDGTAGSTGNYYIQFNVGAAKVFNDYPQIKLFFNKHIFSKATLWTPISELSKQWSDL